MLVHGGKYRTEDKLKTQTIHKLNTTQQKQTTQNTVEKYQCVLYDDRAESSSTSNASDEQPTDVRDANVSTAAPAGADHAGRLH